MSKERELLKEVLDQGYFSKADLFIRITELLAQPEQEQEVYAKGYAEDMRQQVYEAFEAGRKSALSDDWNKERDAMSVEAWYLPETKQEPLLAETKIEWYGKGFRQGVNEFAPPKPLTEDAIYALDEEGIVENMDDHQVRYVLSWIRRVEKAHGIGVDDE